MQIKIKNKTSKFKDMKLLENIKARAMEYLQVKIKTNFMVFKITQNQKVQTITENVKIVISKQTINKKNNLNKNKLIKKKTRIIQIRLL